MLLYIRTKSTMTRTHTHAREPITSRRRVLGRDNVNVSNSREASTYRSTRSWQQINEVTRKPRARRRAISEVTNGDFVQGVGVLEFDEGSIYKFCCAMFCMKIEKWNLPK